MTVEYQDTTINSGRKFISSGKKDLECRSFTTIQQMIKAVRKESPSKAEGRLSGRRHSEQVKKLKKPLVRVLESHNSNENDLKKCNQQLKDEVAQLTLQNEEIIQKHTKLN